MTKAVKKHSQIEDNTFNENEADADNLLECDEYDGINTIFDELRLIGSFKNNSLDSILEKAIAEGAEFKKWKQSGGDLKNIRFFQNTNDKLKPLAVEKVSASKTLEDTFECKITENSQFEIWECNKDSSRQFPLYRILFSKIINKNKFIISEQLRKDFTLNIEAERKENSLSFKVSFPPFIVENKEKVRVPNFISATLNEYYKFKDSSRFFMWEIYKFWLKEFQQFNLSEVALRLLLSASLLSSGFILTSISSAKANNADDSDYSENLIDEKKVYLIDACSRQQCQDPSYTNKAIKTYALIDRKYILTDKKEEVLPTSKRRIETTKKSDKNVKPIQKITEPKKKTSRRSDSSVAPFTPDESVTSSADTGTTTAKVNSPADGFLALRSEPNAVANKIMEIPHGSTIKVSDCLESVIRKSGRWCQVDYNGNLGWVNNQFLTF